MYKHGCRLVAVAADDEMWNGGPLACSEERAENLARGGHMAGYGRIFMT